MIDLIEAGLRQDDWTGLIYLMGVGERSALTPLDVGNAERRGKTHAVSKNIVNIRRNPDKFARWGYGLDYHLGDLSHAMFAFEAYRKPTSKYRRWAGALFERNAPRPCGARSACSCCPGMKTAAGPVDSSHQWPLRRKKSQRWRPASTGNSSSMLMVDSQPFFAGSSAT